jgi:hypothetical protein
MDVEVRPNERQHNEWIERFQFVTTPEPELMGVKVEPHVLLEDSAKMSMQRSLRGSIDLNE